MFSLLYNGCVLDNWAGNKPALPALVAENLLLREMLYWRYLLK